MHRISKLFLKFGGYVGRTSWSIRHVRGVIQLANRKYLPGSHGQHFPAVLAEPRDEFPRIRTADELSISEALSPIKCGHVIRETFMNDILQYGAILYRGLPLYNFEDFSHYFDGLNAYDSASYAGGQAPRSAVGKNVYTASNEPGEYCIELHNEMAYVSTYPHVVIFYCVVPPGEGMGGETAISDCRLIKENLDPGIVEKFDRLGVKYHFHVGSKYNEHNKHGHSWQMMFKTENKKEVEQALDNEGTSYFWNEDNSINLWRTLPALRIHPKTGENIWFNHIYKKHASGWHFHPSFQGKRLDNDRYPTHSYYGDGTEIEDDVIQHLRDISWKCAVGFQMKKNDVLVMDNMRVQHARLSYTGERKLLAILGYYKDQ